MADFQDEYTIAPAVSGPTGPTIEVDPSNFPLRGEPKGFEDLYEIAPIAARTPTQDTGTWTSAINAATGNAIDAIPIVGPSIKRGTEKFGAMVRSKIYGTAYADELANIQDYVKKSEQAHPVAATGGTVTGAVGPMLAGAGLAPRVFGMAGPTIERALYGAVSNGAINAADSAVRGGSTDDAVKAGALGSLVGGGLPVVGKGLGAVARAATPAVDVATQRLIQRASDLGIPIRPAQVSTSPFVNKLDQMVAKVPGSGMGALVDEQQTGLNRAIARTFGENASAVTPEVMAAAKKRIGSAFDAVEKGTTVRFDEPLISRLKNVVDDASGVLEPGQMAPLNKRINAIIDLADNGEFDGKTFNAMMRKDAPLSRLQKSSDPNIQYYAGKIRTALQDALERSASPEMAQKYNLARLQYRNLKTVEPVAANAPTGNISPLALAAQVRKANPSFAYGGGGDIGDIARIGQRFMRQPPDSGTPLGNQVLRLLGAGGLGVAGTAAGYAAYNSENPLRDTALGLGSLLGAGLTARGATTLLNRPEVFGAALRRLPVALPAYSQLSR